jgi:hypothetical protein
MLLKERLEVLIQLGKELTTDNEALQTAIRKTAFHNAWFTIDNQWKAINAIRDHFLSRELLEKWVNSYAFPTLEETKFKTISLVLAGNIPLVGFHDLLCVFVAGHKSKIKLSDKDPYLIPFLIQNLIDINSSCGAYFEIVEGAMKDFDAVIATGSNNSSRYFEAYFGKYPHIIRKNRNAVAVLRGDETGEDFRHLGEDIFTYFGLGCRNVSKIYVPRGYNFEPLLEVIHEFKELVLHDKYKNNFDYQFTIVILNKIKYHSNGCLMMIENEAIASPIAMVYFEYYDNYKTLSTKLKTLKEEIQCIVAKAPIANLPTFDFGKAQKPTLSDYADREDTMAFLLNL